MKVFYLLTCILLCTNAVAQKDIISLWQKGNSAAKYSDEKALQHYQDAFELAQKQNNFVWQANVLTDISGAYYGLGEYEKGAESCELGIRITTKNKLKIDSVKFKLYSALAANQKSLYRLTEAQQNYAIANKIIQENPKLESQIPLYAAYHFSNQGALWLKLHDIQQSKMFYEKALSISKNIPQKSEFALILSNLSKFYFLSQNYKEGITLQKNAIDFYKKTAKYSSLELAKMYFMLGVFYTKENRFLEAKNNFILCRNICIPQKKVAEFQHHHDAANLEIIRIAILQNQLQEAKNELDKLDLSQLSPNLVYDYWEIYGKYHHQNHNFIPSIKCYTTALKTNNDGNTSNDDLIRVFETNQNISKAYLELHKQTNDISPLENSLLTLSHCIEIGKLIRQNFYNLESKVYFTDKYYSIYNDALNLSYLLYSKTNDKNLLKKVFILAEESKSVILIDKKNLSTNTRNTSSDSLMLKLNAYQTYLSYLKNQAQKDTKNINEYALKVNQTLEKAKYANQAFAKSYQTNTLIDMQKIRQSIPKKTLYLNYIIHKNQLFAIATDKKQSFFRKIDFNNSAFQSHLKNLTFSLSQEPSVYAGFAANQSCEFFYDLLIRNIIPEIDSYNRLIINPDNSFYDISFDILRDKTKQKFLIESHAITYTNNLESAIISPVSRAKISEKWNIFLPMNDTAEILASGLQPLKYSFAEVKGILSDLFKNNSANKQTFLKKLQDDSTKVVMISTHAKAENDDPYLIFDTKNSKDSKLYASELQFIKSKAPLVILSACETNTGKTMGGLGVLSFSKSLELSGCRAVVGSFWEVEAKSMSVLASLFYQNLMDGMDKDLALQKAKLSYLKTKTGEENDLPFYWAHLQIIGNNQAIVHKFSVFAVFAFVAISLVLLSLIYVFFIKNAFSRKSEF